MAALRPLLLLLLLLLPFLSASISAVASAQPGAAAAADDEAALLAFRLSVTLDPSSLLSGWDPSVAHHCFWHGISCDRSSGRVTSLNLTAAPPAEAPLAGSLSPAIGNLTELRTLILSNNAFSGAILPAAFAGLGHLEVLDLSGNNLSGAIPNEICFSRSLRVLDLSRNSLSGSIPENLIGSLRIESIDLSYNQLSGGIRISHSSSCRFLMHLKLSNNYLIDEIPPDIAKCSNLRTLLLNGNILEGRIPADISRIAGLQVLDVSKNSLTDRIPRDLGNCRELRVLVLTNLVDSGSSTGQEFNAFLEAVPPEILSIPTLEILWAPRANLDGQLVEYRNSSCSLRMLNLGQNYIAGSIPEWLGMCGNLMFLDLSSNYLQGSVPVKLGARCMVYLNVSRNSLSGSLFGLSNVGCAQDLLPDGSNGGVLEEELVDAYFAMLLQNAQNGNPFMSILDDSFVVLHDLSWNSFSGSVPSFSLPAERNSPSSYGLSLNNNGFNGSLPEELVALCTQVKGLAVNFSVNQISGETKVISSCSQLKSFEAANNHLVGPIPSSISSLHLLLNLDLRGNHLNGTIPDQLGRLNRMEQILLGGNSLWGQIPVQFGGMTSLKVLDLSRNFFTGSIPSSLANATNLEIVLLDHNGLSGQIPPSFSTLTRLTTLDVSFNNLSGSIPYLVHSTDCKFFKGNSLLQPCSNSSASSPSTRPPLTEVPRQGGQRGRLKPFTVAAVSSATVLVSILLVLVIVMVCGRRKLVRITSLRRKVVMTFTDAPAELTYDNVVRATGNFSIQNLIGTGGFGATYKAELVPGFLVAVKRLSMGRFQGLQQFDAEIRTLGRIRHKNLVTLIGYHMGEADTFLIYNYLSGGNLETFIHSMSAGNVHWPVIHKIGLDVAQALCYLHYSCVPRIVHRDIKPSNILLDEKFNAYLSDFGLARLLEVSETHATTDVAGTFGYVAPEYATTCRVSDKADVYSFGVVLLELMSGKRSLDPSFSEYGNGFTIVAWGRLLIQEGRSGEFFPPSLWEAGPKDKLIGMLRLALSCTMESLPLRPTMKRVVLSLKQLN